MFDLYSALTIMLENAIGPFVYFALIEIHKLCMCSCGHVINHTDAGEVILKASLAQHYGSFQWLRNSDKSNYVSRFGPFLSRCN